MKVRYKNIEDGNIFFDVYDDGILRCVNSKLTYTVEEAERSSELIKIDLSNE